METVLQTEKITKLFGGLAAVSNLDISTYRGDILGIIGPNGSGKTTTLNMISGLIRSTRGQIIYKGQNITHLLPHNRARLGIARTFQTNILFTGMTVLQNVMMGQYASSKFNDWEDIIKTRLTRKKESVQLEKSMGILESLGLVGIKDVEVTQLPHGLRRLVGIAAALGNDPELLLMDEPMSGMNAEEIDSNIGFIQKLHDRGITIIIIEHHMRVIMRICNRAVVLNYGAKIAEGPPKEVAENAEVIHAYLGSKWTVA